jgi:NIMA (never in mitosis gene a)-related kinase
VRRFHFNNHRHNWLINMSMKDFQVLGKLGEGAYSSVFKAKRLIDREFYAIKKVKLANLSEKEKANALNEVRILASFRHPNITCYKEAFIDEGSSSLWYLKVDAVS